MKMIAELTYTRFRPANFHSFIEEHGHAHHALRQWHLPIVGVFRTASGERNQLVELCIYDDYDARDLAHARLWDDPDWRSFSAGPAAMALSEETTLLNPAAFSPLRDRDQLDAAIAQGAGRNAPMLFEMRTYTAIPGKMPTVLRMLQEEGNPLTHQFVEWPVAYFTAETGLANRVMMLWAYASGSERARRKARMLSDPRFQELGTRFNPNFAEQRSDFLLPFAYSPLR
jgi:hypothetical protein